MPLVGVVDDSLAAWAEDVAAKESQRLGQLGVLLLKLTVVCRGLCEHAFHLSEAAVRSFGLLLRVLDLPLGDLSLTLGIFGLLPQLVVAAEQVVKQPLELLRIVREIWYDAQ
jgi:hypothetical protein